jgi:hypothetical protein
MGIGNNKKRRSARLEALTVYLQCRIVQCSAAAAAQPSPARRGATNNDQIESSTYNNSNSEKPARSKGYKCTVMVWVRPLVVLMSKSGVLPFVVSLEVRQAYKLCCAICNSDLDKSTTQIQDGMDDLGK